MYKVIWLMKFREGADPAASRQWWLEHHGSLALQATGLRRYVQNHWIAPTEGDSPLQYDGHVDAWFDSEEAYHETLASPEWLRLNQDGIDGFDPDTLTPYLQGAAVNEYVMRWDGVADGRPYLVSRVNR
jgi:uncharacterized protein (TIGR02118 family)